MPDQTPNPTHRPGSVWLTGQLPSREQRRGRYTRASAGHPGKMLPAIARRAILTWTRPGDLVLDPMAGIATTLVEAIHLGRDALGVEYEPLWACHAADNIALAARQGATGSAQIFTGDARRLGQLVPAELRGRVALVITSPPYGPSTHGQVRTAGPKAGKIDKIDYRYGADPDNLAYGDPDDLAAGFTRILTECAAVLRPGGTVLVTARPYRRGRSLIDVPGMVIAAGTHAGLRLTDRCVALLARVYHGRLITRGSFFQQHNIRTANAAGDRQWLIAHEDLIVFQRGASLDLRVPPGVDGRSPSTRPVINGSGGAPAAPRSGAGRGSGRTSDSCSHYPGPVPGHARPDADRQRTAGPDSPAPQAEQRDSGGRR